MTRQIRPPSPRSVPSELVQEVARTLAANPEATDATIWRAVIRWWCRRRDGTEADLSEEHVTKLRRELGIGPPTPVWRQGELFADPSD